MCGLLDEKRKKELEMKSLCMGGSVGREKKEWGANIRRLVDEGYRKVMSSNHWTHC